MKMRWLYFVCILIFLGGVLSACFNETEPVAVPSETQELLPDATIATAQVLIETQTWQKAYAKVLRESWGREFFLWDIDEDGMPELLAGGPSADADKYANYDVYSYKDGIIKCLGEVGTLSWSFLWSDGNGGILGYSYGAGGGGTYRYYIDNGVLYYDDEIYGYNFDMEGNESKWFRGEDGGRIIVTDETEDEYEKLWKSKIELDRYDITEDNIVKVIYEGDF